MPAVKLDELLIRWQELHEQGQAVPAEELCRDCPELVEPLRRKIEVAQAMGALLGGAESAPAGPAKVTINNAPAAAPATAPIWPEVAGYVVLSELGRGGMGVVYLARQLSLGRLVALKMLSAQATDEERARFRAEAEAIAQILHPNLVQIYEVGEQAGRAYYSMEYVNGVTLRDHVGNQPQASRGTAVMIETLARAMDVVHRHGVIHRDLKPANVLVGVDGVVKISDFGLAKRIDAAELTATGAILGTPSFMAPEQATGRLKEVGPALDIYALGAIMYVMLTGRPPFQAESAWDTIVQVGSAEPEPPSRLQPKVSPELETICLKCLSKSPSQRYPSAAALADDLKRWLNGEPISARPVGPVGRAVKWARRRPAAAALLAVSVAALLTVAIGSLIYSARLSRALDLANAHAEESRQRLVSLCVARGARLMDEGDAFGSLAWFSEALRLDEGDAEREHFHRIRIGATLRSCPRLVQLWTHDGPIRRADFSPDGQRVLTTSDDRTARVWDLASGQPVGPPLQHDGPVIDGNFSPDGRTVLTGSEDGTARLWSAATGQSLLPPLRHDQALNSVAYSPDSRRALTASKDGTARIWDLASGKPLGPPLKHQASVEWAEFSPDGQQAATASDDHTARVWNTATGQPISPPLRHQAPVNGISFHPEGGRVVTASEDATARVWKVETGEALLMPLGHRRSVYRAVFTPDGKKVITGSDDHTSMVWSAETGLPLVAPMRELSGVNWLDCSRDSQWVATANDDNTARVWSTVTGEPLTPMLLHNGAVNDAKFSPDDRYLVTVGNDGIARLWDLSPLRRLLQPPPRPAVAAVEPPLPGRWSSPDGKRLVTAERGYTAQVRDARTHQPIGAALQHSSTVVHAAFSADNRKLITGSDDDFARIWDADTGAPLAMPLWHDGKVTFTAFSLDGRLAITASSDRLARVWHAGTGEPVSPKLTHGGQVNQVVFDESGTLRLLSADGSVTQWEMRPDPRSSAELRELALLLSGLRVDQAGLQPITLRETAAAWRNLRGRCPELGIAPH